jgi:hypothetical protein
VRIPGTGVVGGQGGAVSTPAPSKGKGKVVRVVHINDKVSSDDDVPLQRWMRAPNSSRSVASVAPLAGSNYTVANLISSSMGNRAWGSGGSSTVDNTVAATRAAVEKVVAHAAAAKKAADDASIAKKAADNVMAVKKAANEAVVAKKVMDDATAAKKAAYDAAALKKVADEVAVVKKAIDDVAIAKKAADDAAAMRKAADEAVVVKKAADDAAAAKKAADDAATAGSVSSSVGAKRAAAPSSSTPPAKRRFLGSWKPRYIAQTFICHFLCYIYDFDLVLPAYSVSSSDKSPPSAGSSIVGAPQAGGP